MARLEGAALLGLVVLLVVTPFPGFLFQTECSVTFWKGGCRWKNIEQMLGCLPKKSVNKKHPESLTTKSPKK